MTELGCDFVIYGSRHMGSDEFLLFYREESVAVDADYGTFGPDAAESLLYSSASASDVVAVHRSAQIVV